MKFFKKLENVINDIRVTSELLCRRNWAERNAGNISYNISDFISFSELKELKYKDFQLNKDYHCLKNTILLITATGSKMRDLRNKPEDNLVIVAFKEQTNLCYIFNFNNSNNSPTSELPSHLLIHNFLIQNNSKSKAILHTHPTEIIAFSNSPEIENKKDINDIIFKMHPEVSILIPKGIGFVPYKITGSDDLAEATLVELKQHDCVIWEKHGCLAVGESVIDCFDTIDILAKTINIYFLCKSAGYNPSGLNDKQLNELKLTFNKNESNHYSEEEKYTILEEIEKSTNILILTHINTDGDAIGSSLAMNEYCETKGKNSKIFIDGKVNENYNFLHHISKINSFNKENHSEFFEKADLIIVLDLNDSSRLGVMEDLFLISKAKKIVIDHHLEPRIKTDLSLINIKSSSTGELIWSLLKSDNKLKINKDIANYIYLAIMTDTGNFTFSNTSANTLLSASELVALGANPTYLYNSYYNSVPAKQMKLFGRALSEVEFFFDNHLCVLSVTKEILDSVNATLSDTENFVERLMTIKNMKIAIQITELDNNELKLSFRSKEGINIRNIAIKYNGGGHSQAAGAKAKDISISDLKKMLIEECSKLVYC
ncbi:MAG TPA: rhamnulose-1-phosphate aldolase [Candidatus Kapabacteria bacterium]|nr:rhamnulose-1-phosphate aldolase [Candidatus Kapabacteria bacterium]HPO63800.1 rhamnulose-1-phosphate aldolase [Candidatus Kapabacteria bacterium]